MPAQCLLQVWPARTTSIGLVKGACIRARLGLAIGSLRGTVWLVRVNGLTIDPIVVCTSFGLAIHSYSLTPGNPKTLAIHGVAGASVSIGHA